MRSTRASTELWTKLRLVARDMRAHPTRAEELLWQRLKGKQLAELKFRRQHTIDRFIVDFYCAETAVVIELDGAAHDGRHLEDEARQQHLEHLGLRVLRFRNDDVEQHINEVLATIKTFTAEFCVNAAHPSIPSSPLHIVERGRGRGSPT
ncbi:MAG TPA: DUF559 domain-containing protein [Dehalococcoidia bacterium]|nr:DUF559 domain-containing protein [Dehalococcoidia bacterium]